MLFQVGFDVVWKIYAITPRGFAAESAAVSLVSPFIALCMALNKLYSLSRGLSKMPQIGFYNIQQSMSL